VAARSKAWVCGRSPAAILGSNPTGCMDVCCDCCVFSGRGLCDELITRPEESYRLWCVVVCDLETSWMRRPWPTGADAPSKKDSTHGFIQFWIQRTAQATINICYFVKLLVRVSDPIDRLQWGHLYYCSWNKNLSQPTDTRFYSSRQTSPLLNRSTFKRVVILLKCKDKQFVLCKQHFDRRCVCNPTVL
jgi:hypothetical protein